MVPSVSPPLISDDIARLQGQWDGGCIFSVHDSSLADDWLHDHYEHECLVNLRANKIGGPIPSMFSVDAQALSIFGSMSPKIIEMARELAKLSGFPVMIRPVAEYPSALFKWVQQGPFIFALPTIIVMFRNYESPSLDGESSGSRTGEKSTPRAKDERGNSRHGTSMQRKRHPGHLDGQPEEDEDDVDDRRSPLDSLDPEAESHQREITHDTDILLKILVDGTYKGDFIELETSVKNCWTATRS
ncbi:hypothetical protein PILCRDRAFT_269116 [Piloderma croceum F 1598]|uniref:Uncharacterized protein n=1 Tax=Piloderma croceum (strain F 1598) TaxID=765440 RepID=A0A0C3G8F0_PILCF|nr:hypothetical protein PILCRDRAFT_269116 [Piloderma croceum F 1598]